jgi:hypothetical protein
MYCSNLNANGTVYTFDFDIKDVQVVESNEYVPFIENTMATNTVSDCSGYEHNGTISGALTSSSDSPRYNGSIAISAGGGIFTPINITFSQYTIAF